MLNVDSFGEGVMEKEVGNLIINLFMFVIIVLMCFVIEIFYLLKVDFVVVLFLFYR